VRRQTPTPSQACLGFTFYGNAHVVAYPPWELTKGLVNVRFGSKANMTRLWGAFFVMYVCFWHKADMPLRPVNVRFWG
jgi:hypothetical protein